MSGWIVIAEISYVPIDYGHAMPAWRVPGVLVFIREDDSDVNAPGYLFFDSVIPVVLSCRVSETVPIGRELRPVPVLRVVVGDAVLRRFLK